MKNNLPWSCRRGQHHPSDEDNRWDQADLHDGALMRMDFVRIGLTEDGSADCETTLTAPLVLFGGKLSATVTWVL